MISLIFKKIIVVVILFTLLFSLFRILNPFPLAVLERNLNSIPWLYSTIGLIFSVISGFIIQHRWHMWDNLLDASQKEIDAIRQLYLLSRHFPSALRQRVQNEICEYLELLIHEVWHNVDKGIRSQKIENSIFQLENTIYTALEDMPKRSGSALTLLGSIIENREYRLRFSAHHLPVTLRGFLIYITVTMIILSFFIRIDNLFLDYIFTFSIAMLSLSIYMIIDDLDHPYRPGNWHLTTDDYSKLLDEIKKNGTN